MLWKKKPKKALPKKVLIVGAGTTGLTSAFELARRGIVPQVIDAKREIAPTARATGVSVRSLELLEDAGVTPLLVAAGIKVKYAKITGEECKGLKLDFNDLPHKYISCSACRRTAPKRSCKKDSRIWAATSRTTPSLSA